MSIPDKAVEAGGRIIAEHQSAYEHLDAANRAVLAKGWEPAARAVLEAAEPYLTPDLETLQAGIEEHRMTSAGTAWKDASCKCGWTGFDYWPHQTGMILSLFAAHPEVKS